MPAVKLNLDTVQRAYAIVKAASVEESDTHWTIKGVASTPRTDRAGDIVEPLGAIFALPVKLMWQHMKGQTIGNVVYAKATKAGIPFEAQIPKVREEGLLKQRVDLAVQSIMYNLVGAVSIGFKPIRDFVEEIATGYRFKQWEWLELSLVDIPANPEAVITGIKSLDTELRTALKQPTASGHSAASRVNSRPGDTGSYTPKGTEMSGIKDRIDALQAQRDEAAERVGALATKADGDFRNNLEEDELKEYDLLTQTTLPELDEDLRRYKAHAAAVEKATPVTADAGRSERTGTAARQGRVAQGDGQMKSNSNLPKGTGFTRLCMALMQSKGDTIKAINYAKSAQGWSTSTPEVLNILQSPMNLPQVIQTVVKTGVDVGSTVTDSNATWGSALAQYQNLASEFVELLQPATIVGRIQGLRRVPFNVKIPRQTAGVSAKWVGQGKGKPAGAPDFDTITMAYNKIAVICVMTEELVRFSTPAAEGLVRTDMIAQIAKFKDGQFLDPNVSASADNPAAISQSVTPVSGTGSSIAQVLADLAAAWGKFDAVGLEAVAPVWIMRPRTARYLSTLINANSLPVFPSISAQGGTLQGAPVLVSGSVPISGGSNSYIFLVDANEILLADDGAVSVDVSREASVEMDDTPGGVATQLLSLWQNNLVGLRAELFTTWAPRRSAAGEAIGVTYIDPVAY